LLIQPESLAVRIADKYREWKLGRLNKDKASTEVLNYAFATDTRSTSNAKLPWQNSTTRPKLCQIRDNLYANYMAALFPNENWFIWEPGDEEGATQEKKLAIEAYTRHQLRESRFQQIVGQLLSDWIDYGNCFADVIAKTELKKNDDGTIQSIYIGPELVRISPLDIVFDIKATIFADAPSITRSIVTLGQLEKMRTTYPEWKNVSEAVMAKLKDNRSTIIAQGAGYNYDQEKAQRLTADGFSTLVDYYATGSVELLEFEGDLYDVQADKLYENQRIVVLDRAYVVLNEPIVSWTGVRAKQHCGWRTRPDNCWAMGPLDNLVGLQYRLDHLENMRADAFDQIAFPTKIIKGYVEEFEDRPRERIFSDVEGSVEYLHPDVTILNADLQIQMLEQTMEDMAGAPRTAMGIRTPGEKTAFEVQTLDNSSGRLFQSKALYFEEFFLEPLLNTFLEVSRRNLDDQVLVSTVSDDLGIQEFLQLTRNDITAKGKLTPMGARHFASQAQLVQNITNLSNTGIYQDPQVQAHFSSKSLAKLMVDALNLTKYKVYSENIRVTEQLETQQLASQAQEELAVNTMTPVEDTEGATVEVEDDAQAQATL
jgi:hypothetical protein